MSLMELTVQHGTSLDEARGRLNEVVAQMNAQFGTLLQRVEWSEDRNGVKLFGPGIQAEIRIDAANVHVTADIPVLGRLMGGRLLDSMKTIVQQEFKRLN